MYECWCVCHVGACSEWPHASAEGWGSVGWCDSYIQIVSDLEALRLQRHGVICALPARYSAADVFQPDGGEQTHVSVSSTNSQTSYKVTSSMCPTQHLL